MISYDEFKNKYNLSEKQFKDAGFSWEDLGVVYNDFIDRIPEYSNILEDFITDYFSPSRIRKKDLRVHSIGSRIKDPEHLIAKLIRRKIENYQKYKDCDAHNYHKFITDLVGIRILMVYKTEWENIHQYLIDTFENNEKNYIRNPVTDFDPDINHIYMAEAPKVHIRNGDRKEIYTNVLSPDKVEDDKIYRSVHYIIKYKGIYIEIQVRTLFEEGWGEVDHSIMYPTHNNNPVFKEYTELLNRLSGLADEMSSFFVVLKDIGAGEKEEQLFLNNDSENELVHNAKENNADSTGIEEACTYENAISRVIRK